MKIMNTLICEWEILIKLILGTAWVSTLWFTIRCTGRKWGKRMVRNVSKPTYFGSAHVLNSKWISEPCEQFCFCYKFNHKHDQIFIKHNFRHCKLHIRVQTHNTHACTIRRYVNIRVCTQHFWPINTEKYT